MIQKLLLLIRNVFIRISAISDSKKTFDSKVISDQIELLKVKYNLWDYNFDSECIYNDGDLTEVIKPVIDNCFPDFGILITETISEDNQKYIAELSNKKASMRIYANTFTDFLPDEFYGLLESIPLVFGSDKRLYQINPAIGITGQDAWYFCGTHENLSAARKEGLPLVFPGEDFSKTEEYKKYRGFSWYMS